MKEDAPIPTSNKDHLRMAEESLKLSYRSSSGNFCLESALQSIAHSLLLIARKLQEKQDV